LLCNYIIYIHLIICVFSEIHDFAAKRLKILKTDIDNKEPLYNSWKFVAKLSLPEDLKIETSKQKS